MRLRRSLSLAAAAAATLTGFSVAMAPAAHANGYVQTYSSVPKGGYGIVDLSSTQSFYACDYGGADGLRVVGHIWPQGHSYRWVQDANGSNNGCGSAIQLNLPIGTHYTMQACLRDGPGGLDDYCRTEEGVIYT
ncbi:hypothetical protein ACIQXD_04995 [Streptomyces uncialis]|uniref:hypothetical protein n=1 Tax=Streptomyces uncialis TaxID=1048205 RepID=UPI0037F60727